ncbi:hypothetical protein GC194_09280 [bacterium]|nr:hypothetical protein [bacterium]
MSLLNKDRISELFQDNDDSQNRRKSLLITTFVTAALTVLFTIFGFKTPLPLPAEEGQIVLVGYEDADEVAEKPDLSASKKVESEEITDETELEEPPTETTPVETDMATSEEEDAPEMEAPEKPAEATTKPTPVEKPAEKPTETEKPSVPAKSEGEELADELGDLLGSSKEKSKGDPKSTRTIGENAITYQKTSFGSVGIVDGTGLSLVNMPNIDEKTQENADVYIKIKVDRDGHVLEARNDVSRSTTTNLSLINKSIENAKKSTFKRTDLTAMITEAVLEYKYRLN